MKCSAFVFIAAAALAGCQKSAAPAPSADSNPAAHGGGAPSAKRAGIDWFQGSVKAAFAKARQEEKLVFLYWSAQWCAPCHKLKATVFTRPEFIERTRRFVSVYLDGDEPGAKQWGEIFNAQNYPTVLLLRADRSERTRIVGAQDLNRYLTAFDAALDKRPVRDILASLQSGTASLSLEECKRLAYGDYREASTAHLLAQDLDILQRAAQRCPGEARIERARLTVMHANAVVQEEFKKALQGMPAAVLENPEQAQQALQGKLATPRLKAAVRELLGIMEDRRLAKAVAEVSSFDFEYGVLNLAARTGAAEPAELDRLHRQWIAASDAEIDDASLPLAERLDALRSKLARTKERDPQGRIPQSLAQDALRHVERALADTPSGPARVGVVSVALSILKLLGEWERAKAIVAQEIKTAADPAYYVVEMAKIEEGLGRKDAALH